jgi:hypothetical protein
MADTKISALTSATTPLAGTEVLPIVQSSTTVKVAVNDLTVRNIRAAATTGILQVSGPTAGTTRTVTVPDANFTAARTDAAQSFTGDQTLSTGNLVQGTAAKGFNFTANTAAAGMTSQLLNWYEEGTWTLTVTASTPGITPPTFTSTSGTYTRIGRSVYITYNIQFNANGTGAGYIKVAGLPFNLSQRGFGVGQEVAVVGFNTISNGIASTNFFYVTNFAGAYPGGTSYNLLGSFTYII